MAEVYRARDARLGRSVALKVVNEALAQDPDLLQRFEQEARLAGSLNHPNLVAVYDVGSHDGSPYFVTELLKGESLRERLSRGRPSLETALDWGTQLAQGLAAAHANGIVHRDVKPDNVFVTSDGQVKLLDFGIAKLGEKTRTDGPHDLLEETVTPTGGATRTGAILGTPGYMSPEQVRGDKVDARSDIFSLGAVLYEMLSGQRPFRGGSLIETGHSILHDEPPPLEGVPPFVAQLVKRCLAKEPEARIQSARDLAFALEMLRSGEPRRETPARSRRSLFARSWWIPVLLAGLAAAVGVGRRFSPHPTAFPRPERVTLRAVNVDVPARFTPDGRVVFSGRTGAGWGLFERNLTSSSVQQLPIHNSQLAAISATNEFAVFQPFLPQVWGSATLSRVPGGGGTPRVIAEHVRSADWGPSGDLAIIRALPTGSRLEYPIGKPLFETKEPSWLTDVR